MFARCRMSFSKARDENETIPMWYVPKSTADQEAFEESREIIKKLLLAHKKGGVALSKIIYYLMKAGNVIYHTKFDLTFNEFLFHCQDFIHVRMYIRHIYDSTEKFIFLNPDSVDRETKDLLTRVQEQITGKLKKSGQPRATVQNTNLVQPDVLLDPRLLSLPTRSSSSSASRRSGSPPRPLSTSHQREILRSPSPPLQPASPHKAPQPLSDAGSIDSRKPVASPPTSVTSSPAVVLPRAPVTPAVALPSASVTPAVALPSASVTPAVMSPRAPATPAVVSPRASVAPVVVPPAAKCEEVARGQILLPAGCSFIRTSQQPSVAPASKVIRSDVDQRKHREPAGLPSVPALSGSQPPSPIVEKPEELLVTPHPPEPTIDQPATATPTTIQTPLVVPLWEESATVTPPQACPEDFSLISLMRRMAEDPAGQHQNFISLTVTGFKEGEPGLFFVRVKDVGGIVSGMEYKMKVFYEYKPQTHPRVTRNEIRVNEIYGGFQRETQSWRRVQVLMVKDDVAEGDKPVVAFLIDHGILVDLDFEDIRYLKDYNRTDAVIQHAYFASCAYLDHEPRMTEQAVHFFIDSSIGQAFLCHLCRVEQLVDGPHLMLRFALNLDTVGIDGVKFDPIGIVY